MRWMMHRWWCEGGGDRAWWVIERVFLRSPDKGSWACLGDLERPLRDLMSTTHYCRLFKATTAYTSACTDAGAALAPLLSRGARVRHWQSARRLWQRRLQLLLDDCCRLVLPYNAEHSIQQTVQITNDPPQMGAKSTTTSNHPSTPPPLDALSK